MKRIIAAALILCLCFSLCACSAEQVGSFTILEEIGEKQFTTIYRSGDRVQEVVDAAMSVLAANGSLGSISLSWLGNNLIELDGDLEAINGILEMPPARTLIVGVDTDAPPYAYYSGGSLVGMTVDIAKAIGSLLGWAVQVLPVQSNEIEAHLASGNIDVALGFAPECVDPEKYSLGKVFMSSTLVLAVPENSDISSVRKIDDARVGTIGDPALDAALAQHDKLSKHASGITEYLTPPRCLEALQNGWCVAVALDEFMLRAYAATYVPASTPAPVQ